MTEDEMAGWNHQLDGREFEQRGEERRAEIVGDLGSSKRLD